MENLILDNLADLHTALYNKLVPLTVAIPGLELLGFDSSRTNNPLPPVAVKMTLRDIDVDRTRPTPRLGNSVYENTGTPLTLTYDGETFTDVYPEFIRKYPLPVLLNYELDTWSHSAMQQLAIDQEILKILPERGCLFVTFNSVEYALPITLIGIENLDDYRENFRERLYRYNIEAYVKSWVPDKNGKIIINPIFEVYKGNKPEDAASKNLLDVFDFKPE